MEAVFFRKDPSLQLYDRDAGGSSDEEAAEDADERVRRAVQNLVVLVVLVGVT